MFTVSPIFWFTLHLCILEFFFVFFKWRPKREKDGLMLSACFCALLSLYFLYYRELQNIQKTCVKEQSEDESDLGGWQTQVNQCEEESYGSQKDRSFWSLYFSVKNYKNAMGQNLAEPFYKLPSQRCVFILFFQGFFVGFYFF